MIKMIMKMKMKILKIMKNKMINLNNRNLVQDQYLLKIKIQIKKINKKMKMMEIIIKIKNK